MKIYRIKFILLAVFCISLVQQVYPQAPMTDTPFHPYKVNYWVSGSICGIGAVANMLGIRSR